MIMTVSENTCCNINALSHRPFCRIDSTINHRLNILNYYALLTFH